MDHSHPSTQPQSDTAKAHMPSLGAGGHPAQKPFSGPRHPPGPPGPPRPPGPGPPLPPGTPSTNAPSIPGFNMVWSDDFDGPFGSAVNGSKWETITGPGQNQEVQVYMPSLDNIHLSGDGNVNIVPLLVPDKGPNALPGAKIWTSGRLHGRQNFGCAPGKQMIVQARIRLGANPQANQKGIWPAFWTLGIDFHNQGVGWPKCGEWDIMEVGDGKPTSNVTIHSGEDPQHHFMIPNTPIAGTSMDPRGSWHVWTGLADRSKGPGQEALHFFMDGKPTYDVLQKDYTGPQDLWVNLVEREVFPLLNVAVGGGVFAGPPDPNTLPGLESGMQVGYVAIYQQI